MMDKTEPTGVITPELVTLAMNVFDLDLMGLHGVGHWIRVWENSLALAHHTPGVNVRVIELFAWLHDICRVSEGGDIDHGRRAACILNEMGQSDVDYYFSNTVSPADIWWLIKAIREHRGGLPTTKPATNPTVGVCWDADRLDLARLHNVIRLDLLSTEAAKTKEMLDWSAERATRPVVLLPWIRGLVEEQVAAKAKTEQWLRNREKRAKS